MTRREEIRALEGRRKALEAIKKAALESENQFMNKLDENSTTVKKTMVQKFNKEEVNDHDDDKMVKIESMEPFHKKFQNCLQDFYQNANNYANHINEADDEKLNEDLFDDESIPVLPAINNKTENKDKELLKEKLENLQEKKRQVDKLIQDLNRLKDKANIGNESNEIKQNEDLANNYSFIKSELTQNQNQIDLIKSSVNASNSANNTAIKAEKIINLLENQEKLE